MPLLSFERLKTMEAIVSVAVCEGAPAVRFSHWRIVQNSGDLQIGAEFGIMHKIFFEKEKKP